MKINDIISSIEDLAPLALQEDYDNAGLVTGNLDSEINSALISVDVTEEVIDEAIRLGIKLIIAHHPVIFSGIKKIIGKNFTERIIIKAIKNDIAIYSAHTNLDNSPNGVNASICKKLGLIKNEILAPKKNELCKIVTFVPEDYTDKVREALFNAGAGHIGNYDACSYNIKGEGTFRGGENTDPFIGEKGKINFETETRVETIFPKYLKNKIIRNLLSSHPYEEVAYGIYPLENDFNTVGSGMIGELEKEMNEINFLQFIKETFHSKVIRHSKLLNKPIKKVAVCGGSGSFLIKNAISKKADIFITGDMKYHQFFDTENKIIIADIGHFESEQFTMEIFYDLLTKKFPKFAVRLSEINTNPINYF